MFALWYWVVLIERKVSNYNATELEVKVVFFYIRIIQLSSIEYLILNKLALFQLNIRRVCDESFNNSSCIETIFPMSIVRNRLREIHE